MYKNYFITALRHLQARKQYAALTIIGLMTGITCALIAFIFVRHEFSYENEIPDADDIYRVEQAYHFPGAAEKRMPITSPLIGESISNYFAPIKATTQMYTLGGFKIKRGNDSFLERVAFVEQNFLSFFSLPLVLGDTASALSDINALLVSETMAQKYFGATAVIGKTLTLDDKVEYRITGVFKDLPHNTHLALDFIVLYDEGILKTFLPGLSFPSNWYSNPLFNYIKLNPGADISNIQNRLAEYTNQHYVHPDPSRAAMTPTDFVTYSVRAIGDIYLYSQWRGELKPGNSVTMVLGFLVIALLVLTIAIINYASLATATSTLRAREIGLRKVLGADFSDIRWQFISEALLTAIIATILAMLLTQLLLPSVSQLLNLAQGSLQLFNSLAMVLAAITFGVVSGLLAGLYPAFYLSSIRPIKVLGSNKSSEKATSWIRSLLLVIQFSVTIGLLVSLAVVTKQTQFVSQVDMGIDKSSTSILDFNTAKGQQQSHALLRQLRTLPGVSAAGSSTAPSTWSTGIPVSVQLPQRQGEDALNTAYVAVDAHFFPTYGVKAVAGRLFSEDHANDRLGQLTEELGEVNLNIIINQSAVGFVEAQSAREAVGKQFTMIDVHTTLPINATVVGVVPDINLGSAYDKVEPMFYIDRSHLYYKISIKSDAQSHTEVMNKVRAIWQTLAAEEMVNINHLDTMTEALYATVKRQNTLLLILSGLAIMISCLGVYGMATFSVQRRTKEIGIRKIMGAEVKDIMALMLLQFSKPVLIAMLIAWPVSGYIMSDWLQSFVLRIDLNPLFFVFAGLVTLLITWLTIAGHVYKAASAKPVNALRYE
ncbi:MAG: putative ABC transport system permease protein [Phenylobacterium sp.]|jgi:putative ABC transport system permease protein